MSATPQEDSADKSPGLDILRIDQVCDEYERALRTGSRPDLAAAIQGFDPQSKTALLGELFLLEYQYQNESDAPEIALVEKLRRSHPELTDELENAIDLIKDRLGLDGSFNSATATFRATPYRLGQPPESRFLEVPCPNCREVYTVAADTNSTEVTCRLCGSTFSLSENTANTKDSSALTTVGHFKLTTRLGVGGCGTVWKAYDTQLDRTVAIKIPRAEKLSDEEEARFLREAQSVARLRHPNIVPIHEFGRDGELLYFVSDYIRGVSLDSWLTGKAIAMRDAVALAARIADALHYAHQQGVIHRDVKPSNILLDAAGNPHLTDFGLAMLNRPDISHEKDGFLGTPAYMSPEQAAGEAHRCDARTDVYALGVVLFQLLTGELPFRGNSEMLLYQIQFAEAVSPRTLNRRIPKDLETICLKCLQKTPAARYDSAGALADDLRSFLAGKPITARPVPWTVHCWRWCLRKPAAAAALGLLIFVAVAGPAMALHQSTLRQRAEQAEAETHDFYQQYIAQGLVPAPSLDSESNSPLGKSVTAINRELSESAQQHTLTRIGTLPAENADLEQAAYLYLTAGLLATSQNDTESAIRNLEEATKLLAELKEQFQGALRYEAAEAFCKLRLVRHHLALEKYAATASTLQKAEEAAGAWEALSERDPKSLWFQHSYAESKLWLSLALGEQLEALDAAKESVVTVKQIESLWPDKPLQLYLIACELTKSEPVLAPQGDLRPSLR